LVKIEIFNSIEDFSLLFIFGKEKLSLQKGQEKEFIGIAV
jgi:hypothetical protein